MSHTSISIFSVCFILSYLILLHFLLFISCFFFLTSWLNKIYISYKTSKGVVILGCAQESFGGIISGIINIVIFRITGRDLKWVLLNMKKSENTSIAASGTHRSLLANSSHLNGSNHNSRHIGTVEFSYFNYVTSGCQYWKWNKVTIPVDQYVDDYISMFEGWTDTLE
jgi:hypothetical protein